MTLGEKVVHVGHPVIDVPRGFWAVAQPFNVLVGEGDSGVRSERFDDVEIVVLNRIERLLVRRADVVALQELLDEYLPVHRAKGRPDGEKPVCG
jgi:hypothetical protein